MVLATTAGLSMLATLAHADGGTQSGLLIVHGNQVCNSGDILGVLVNLVGPVVTNTQPFGCTNVVPS